uniref:Putative secreted protein n=1 Tax=Ixodes scapularis TaxID=6945 RepID=A0A4D5RVL1_IXOSC
MFFSISCVNGVVFCVALFCCLDHVLAGVPVNCLLAPQTFQRAGHCSNHCFYLFQIVCKKTNFFFMFSRDLDAKQAMSRGFFRPFSPS